MKDAFDVIKQHNLCTYYLLPLIGINKFSFGVHINFRNCYVHPDGSELYVSVYYLSQMLKEHEHLLRTEGAPGAPVYVFRLPEKWLPDFQRYRLGKYSEFSKEAKELIIHQSGLRYRTLNDSGLPSTDLRLLAIESDAARRNILRNKLSEFLGSPIAEDAELLDAPTQSSFATINQSLMTYKS